MKKRTIITMIMALLLCMTASARAELKTTGTGAAMEADISAYPPNMKAIYPLLKVKCAKCHGLDRTFVTLQSGMTPSGAVFDNAAIDAYGAKMLRKPDANMSKQETKSILELMRFMLEEAAK